MWVPCSCALHTFSLLGVQSTCDMQLMNKWKVHYTLFLHDGVLNTPFTYLVVMAHFRSMSAVLHVCCTCTPSHFSPIPTLFLVNFHLWNLIVSMCSFDKTIELNWYRKLIDIFGYLIFPWIKPKAIFSSHFAHRTVWNNQSVLQQIDRHLVALYCTVNSLEN